MTFASNFSPVSSEEIALRKAMQQQDYIIHRGDKRFYNFARTNPADWSQASFVLDKEAVTAKVETAPTTSAMRPESKF